MMLWHESRLGSLLVGVIALRKYECIEYAVTVSSSAIHPSETSDEPIGFFWWWLIVLVFCLPFKACGDNKVERSAPSGSPQRKKHGRSLSFCLAALCWVVVKIVLLYSAFQQHAAVIFIKAKLLGVFYRWGNCDTTQCSDLSHVIFPSTRKETGPLWLFDLSKGSITATVAPWTWKVTLCFTCFFLYALSSQHPFLNIVIYSEHCSLAQKVC